MKRRCFCCGKEYEYKAGVTGLEVGSTLPEYKYPCIDCCKEIGLPSGFKGMMKAGMMSAEKFLNEYISINPEAGFLLDDFHAEKKQQWNDTKSNMLNGLSSGKSSRSFAKEQAKREKKQRELYASGKLERKHTCLRCGHVWYSDHTDDLKQFVKATTLLSGNDDLSRNMATVGAKEPDQCPKCGSRNAKAEFVPMKSEVLPEIEYASEPPTPAPAKPNATDAADEIRKFKALMDDGIISAEEFEAKKKQLLGL